MKKQPSVENTVECKTTQHGSCYTIELLVDDKSIGQINSTATYFRGWENDWNIGHSINKETYEGIFQDGSYLKIENVSFIKRHYQPYHGVVLLNTLIDLGINEGFKEFVYSIKLERRNRKLIGCGELIHLFHLLGFNTINKDSTEVMLVKKV